MVYPALLVVLIALPSATIGFIVATLLRGDTRPDLAPDTCGGCGRRAAPDD